jgi:hypothetical protein
MSIRFAFVLFTCILLPWEVYQTVPVLNIGLAGILLCCLGGMAAWDFQRHNSLRIPFEIWMPLFILAAFEIWRTESIAPSSIGAVIALLVVAQNLRTRVEVLWSLSGLVVSVGIFSVFNGMAYTIGLVPTVFSLYSTISFFGPSSVQHGVTLFGIALCGAVALSSSSEIPPFMRALGTLCILLPIGSLAAALYQVRDSMYPWSAGYGLDGFTPGWFTLLIGFWVVARIIAKAGLAEHSKKGAYGAFIAMGCIIIVSFSLIPGDIPLVYGAVLGLMLAYGMPEKIEETAKVSTIQLAAAGILAFVLMGWNILMPSIGNPNDMRNVDLWVSQSKITSSPENEVRYLYGALENYPDDRVHTLLSLGLTAHDDAEQASQFIVEAAQEVPVSEWGAESQIALKKLMVLLRDESTQASGNGNTQFFYERSKAASDSMESALQVLRIRAKEEEAFDGMSVPEPLVREVISWAVTGESTPKVINELSNWDSELLQKLLRIGQVNIHTNDSWPLPFNEPVVLFFGQHGGKYVCRIWSGSRTVEQPLDVVPPWPMSKAEIFSRPEAAEWVFTRRTDESGYKIDLKSSERIEPWLHIEFKENGEPSIHWPRINNWGLPNEPITAIWLP